jgi:hypothetical protein
LSKPFLCLKIMSHLVIDFNPYMTTLYNGVYPLAPFL